jgi:D-alanyl-D-alanine carboxypeptidase (penicillin-binding protein 5/6)
VTARIQRHPRRPRGAASPHALAPLLVALLAVAGWLVPAPARAGIPPAPRVSGASAAVVEASTGQPVLAVDASERRLIASTTKMMTALVAVESLPLDRVCTAPGYAASPLETQIGLAAGERMAVRDLLTALMLASANDAAATLAVCASGSREAFVARMNRRARELRLTGTRFANPVGLDAPTNYSTAADLARLGIEVRRKRFLRRTVDLRSAPLATGAVPRTVINRNRLVQAVPWVNGVKTGHTNAAGYLLVGSGTRRGVTYVAAVTGEPSESARDADTLALLRWAFAAYAFQTPVRSRAVLARPRLKHREDERIDVIATRTVRELLRRDRRARVTVTVPEELQGPLPQHAVVGTATVRVGRRVLARVPLVTRTEVPEVGLLERAGKAVARPGSLILIVVIGGAAAGLVLLRRHRHGTRGRRGRADMEAA